MNLYKHKLSELLDVKRGASLSGKFYATEGKLVRLTCGNFDYTNNCFKENTSKDDIYFTGPVREEFIMKKGDIITPLTEQAIGLLGSTAMIPEDDKYIQSQDVAKIICKEGILYPKFAFYLISSAPIKKQLSAGAQQTKIRHTSPDKIKDCTAWIPDYDEQVRIGDFLSSIDSKIALNRRINQKLEETARRLYDYWFLQFEFPAPVGSLTADGQPIPEGAPYRSSGGAMVHNAILNRPIPTGWEVKNLYHIAKFTNGLACQKFRPTDDNHKLPVIKIGEMHGGISANTEFVRDNIPDGVKVYDGDILFSWSASLEVMLWAYGNGGLNQHIFKVTSNNGYPKSFYFYELLDYVQVFRKIADSRKTTMGHITSEHLEQSEIPLPPTLDIPNAFEKEVAPLLDQQVQLSKEIIRLCALRDRLLPLLMNGQITIS